MRQIRVSTRDLVIVGYIVSAVGDQAVIVVTAFVALNSLGDSTQYGLFYSLAYVAPFVLAAVSGALADRAAWARRFSIGGLLTRGALNSALATAFFCGLASHATVAVVALGAFQLIHSAVTALTNPAMLPTLRLVADGDEEWLDHALAVVTVQRNLARLIGPVVGGLVITAAVPGVAYALNAASFVAIAIPLHRCMPARRPTQPRTPPTIHEAPAGYRGLLHVAPDFLVYECVELAATFLLIQPYLILGRMSVNDEASDAAALIWALTTAAFAAGGICAPLIARTRRYRAAIPATSHYEFAALLGVMNAVLLFGIVTSHRPEVLLPIALIAGAAKGLAEVSVNRALATMAPRSLGAATSLSNVLWSSSVLAAGLLLTACLQTTSVRALGTTLSAVGLCTSMTGFVVLTLARRMRAVREEGRP